MGHNPSKNNSSATHTCRQYQQQSTGLLINHFCEVIHSDQGLLKNTTINVHRRINRHAGLFSSRHKLHSQGYNNWIVVLLNIILIKTSIDSVKSYPYFTCVFIVTKAICVSTIIFDLVTLIMTFGLHVAVQGHQCVTNI